MKTFKHNGETYAVGERVSCEVTWRDGRKTFQTGTLVTIADGEVFIDTDVGLMAGDLETLEKA